MQEVQGEEIRIRSGPRVIEREWVLREELAQLLYRSRAEREWDAKLIDPKKELATWWAEMVERSRVIDDRLERLSRIVFNVEEEEEKGVPEREEEEKRKKEEEEKKKQGGQQPGQPGHQPPGGGEQKPGGGQRY